MRSLKSGSSLLGDLALQQAGANGEFVFVSLGEERVETTAMFDRTQSGGGHAKTETLAERVGKSA